MFRSVVQDLRVAQFTRSVTGLQIGGDGSPLRIATTRHCLTVRDMFAIEHRPPHLYECLWRHYFRTRNTVTLLSPAYLSCLQVAAARHEPSPLLTTRYGSGVLDMYGAWSTLTGHERVRHKKRKYTIWFHISLTIYSEQTKTFTTRNSQAQVINSSDTCTAIHLKKKQPRLTLLLILTIGLRLFKVWLLSNGKITLQSG